MLRFVLHLELAVLFHFFRPLRRRSISEKLLVLFWGVGYNFKLFVIRNFLGCKN